MGFVPRTGRQVGIDNMLKCTTSKGFLFLQRYIFLSTHVLLIIYLNFIDAIKLKCGVQNVKNLSFINCDNNQKKSSWLNAWAITVMLCSTL